MLAGLWVKNFKSIEAAGIRFGPLTCFVGRNGVGKTNLFDAICFLSRLAERDTSGAAVKIRQASGQGFSPLDLVFGRDPKRLVEFSADMIVPAEVTDDFGVPAKPSTTLLTYRLKLRYAPESDRLLVESESLTHAKLGDFKRFARFPSSDGFKSSVALGSRRGGPLISTEDDRIILHGDGGSRARSVPAGRSPSRSSEARTHPATRPCSPRGGRCRRGASCIWSRERCGGPTHGGYGLATFPPRGAASPPPSMRSWRGIPTPDRNSSTGWGS